MMYPFAISFDGRENPREAVAHVLRQTSVGRDLFAIGWNAAMQFQKSAAFSQSRALPMPVNVIFRAPATIVFWDDGDKTVVKCQPDNRAPRNELQKSNRNLWLPRSFKTCCRYRRVWA